MKKYKQTSRNGKNKLEHRLIIEQAIGRELRPDEVVHHIDGDGRNNNLSNLKIMDRIQHYRMENQSIFAKLSTEDVKDIRKMLKDGIKQILIAKTFGVSNATISLINVGKRWGWVRL